MDLINPRSAVSGATPIVKESEHFFFDLPSFEGMLKEWTRSGSLQPEIANKMQEWFESGLQQWDISRRLRLTLVSQFQMQTTNSFMCG